MQIQMVVLFFYSGISKMARRRLEDGDAVWIVFTTDEHYNAFILSVLASHYWLVNFATYGTILIEIAYCFSDLAAADAAVSARGGAVPACCSSPS